MPLILKTKESRGLNQMEGLDLGLNGSVLVEGLHGRPPRKTPNHRSQGS